MPKKKAKLTQDQQWAIWNMQYIMSRPIPTNPITFDEDNN